MDKTKNYRAPYSFCHHPEYSPRAHHESYSLIVSVSNQHENDNNKQEKFHASDIVASNSEGNTSIYVLQIFSYASINFY